MGVLTLVLGGARSGKSAQAEALALKGARAGARPRYLATATASDAEMAERIALHRARRGERFDLTEEPLELVSAIDALSAPDAPLLIECLTLWLANLLEAGRSLDDERARLHAALGRAKGPVILVSNEVGLGIVPANALARRYADEAGRLNQELARKADRVLLMVAGLPLALKGATP